MRCAPAGHRCTPRTTGCLEGTRPACWLGTGVRSGSATNLPAFPLTGTAARRRSIGPGATVWWRYSCRCAPLCRSDGPAPVVLGARSVWALAGRQSVPVRTPAVSFSTQLRLREVSASADRWAQDGGELGHRLQRGPFTRAPVRLRGNDTVPRTGGTRRADDDVCPSTCFEGDLAHDHVETEQQVRQQSG